MTDWSNFAIHRFNLAGTQLSNFSNPDINHAIEQTKRDNDDYKLYSSFALIGFFTVFGLGVLAAFVLEKKETLSLFKGNFPKEDELDNDSSILESPLGKDIYWIEAKHRKYRKPLAISILLGTASVPLLMIFLFSGNEDINLSLIILTAFLIPVFTLGAWVNYRILSTKIGISGQLLLIDEGNETIGVGKESAIEYTNNVIIIGKAVAFIGQPNNSLFPKNELEKWIKPRVTRGQKISEWHYYKKLWALKHPLIFLLITILAFMPIILLLS